MEKTIWFVNFFAQGDRIWSVIEQEWNLARWNGALTPYLSSHVVVLAYLYGIFTTLLPLYDVRRIAKEAQGSSACWDSSPWRCRRLQSKHLIIVPSQLCHCVDALRF